MVPKVPIINPSVRAARDPRFQPDNCPLTIDQNLLQQTTLMYCARVDRDVTPALLHASSHPLRWRLLRALAAGDQPVHVLTATVGASQNLVSYHLGQLRKAELV